MYPYDDNENFTDDKDTHDNQSHIFTNTRLYTEIRSYAI